MPAAGRYWTTSPRRGTTSLAGPSAQVTVYPDAGHAFLNDHAPGEMPLWARIPGRYARTEYHEPSAVLARDRIIEFLGRHLGAPDRARKPPGDGPSRETEPGD